MFCTSCEKEQEGNSAYCTNCGARLADGTVSQPGEVSAVTRRYASFPKRFAAAIIDYVIITVINALIAGILLSISDGGIVTSILDISGIVVGWLYFAIMETTSNQATLGKMALGIIVTDIEGNKVSFRIATLRFFAKIISAVILFIGFFMIAFTKKKQGLHDKLAGTLVLQKK